MSTETIASPTTKDRVQTLLKSLPDNCTLEDVQYGLYVLQKVQNGLEQLDRGEDISDEEARKRLGKWLTE